MPDTQTDATLTAGDFSLINDLCDSLSDEQGRLHAYGDLIAQGLLFEQRAINLGYRLHLLIERLARAILDGEHMALTQTGTSLDMATWVERAMGLLADARAIATPPLERNDISTVAPDEYAQGVA